MNCKAEYLKKLSLQNTHHCVFLIMRQMLIIHCLNVFAMIIPYSSDCKAYMTYVCKYFVHSICVLTFILSL